MTSEREPGFVEGVVGGEFGAGEGADFAGDDLHRGYATRFNGRR